jgi:hypothetical protein
VLQKELYNLHILIYVFFKALFEAPCILGHSYLVEVFNFSVIPKSHTAVSCIIKLSDYIFMVEVTYHPVRFGGRREYQVEPEGSPLIKSGCSCSGTG